MIGLVFAMKEEAVQVLSKYDLEKVDESGRIFYVDKESVEGRDRIIATISGIGKVNAQIATSILIGIGCDKIVNIGTCGCTGDRFNPGEAVVPNLFFDGDFDLSMMDTTTKDPAMVNRDLTIDTSMGVPCYTYSTFITDDRASDGIVDMEAYGIVAQCRAVGVPVLVIKIVSDGGDTSQFEDNVETVITKHVDFIKELIEGDIK